MKKKTVVFDFDGVIHSYTSGWKGPDNIPDPVVPGIAEVISKLREKYEVVVVSTRCASSEGMNAMVMYLAENNIVVDRIMAEKPPAICYVDDRALRFDGNTETLYDEIVNFHSWIEKRKQRKYYDCANYRESTFCGYTSSHCTVHGSLDQDQKERHPDRSAATCDDYVFSRKGSGS